MNLVYKSRVKSGLAMLHTTTTKLNSRCLGSLKSCQQPKVLKQQHSSITLGRVLSPSQPDPRRYIYLTTATNHHCQLPGTLCSSYLHRLLLQMNHSCHSPLSLTKTLIRTMQDESHEKMQLSAFPSSSVQSPGA